MANRLASSNQNVFKQDLYDLWFGLYRRKTNNDSSGFEHVFVGEEKEGKVMGMHNWVQLYCEERANRLDYKGYIPPRGRNHQSPVNEDQVVTIQFAWEGGLKPVSTSFIGTSPEFELALFTMAFLSGHEDNHCVLAGRYKVNIKCYSYGRGSHRKIGTAFPEALN